jgi:hypothetical protein
VACVCITSLAVRPMILEPLMSAVSMQFTSALRSAATAHRRPSSPIWHESRPLSCSGPSYIVALSALQVAQITPKPRRRWQLMDEPLMVDDEKMQATVQATSITLTGDRDAPVSLAH